jgi:hypothetical protein
MNTKSILNGILLLCIVGVVLNGCETNIDSSENSKFAKIYMPQAVDYPAQHSLDMVDSIQTIIYGANLGGANSAPTNIQVQFSVDSALVDSFNMENGTHYKLMPEAGYELSQKAAVIPAGNYLTKPLKISITTIGALMPVSNYLLPISLNTSGNVQINKTLQTTYFLIDTQINSDNIKLIDRTKWKVIDVDSHQITFPGKYAIDGDPNTVWHSKYSPPPAPPPHHITIDMGKSHVLSGLKIIGRTGPSDIYIQGNPVDVTVKVSNDAKNWGDGEKITFPLDLNTIEAKVSLHSILKGRYFKLIITKVVGGDKVVWAHIAEVYAYGI